MNKIIGLLLAIGIFTGISAMLTGIDIPLPSSYITVVFASNGVFAFFSIFTQRLVMALYETNVYEERSGFLNQAFKYIAIFTSGINYHVQKVLNRLPLFFNKFLAFCFFLSLVWIGFGIIGIFN
ncbi:hypothetical protein [Cytobacillus horneckiae]|uniref:Uncharacterized protein n=1 Tax=Cytobacillus horneckiae TaxID=549687 RepID=A0A2N0ZCC9_9BACI|nr:hypothetical protein [Cytobacillus horneckiae]MED2936393.1 hypothetical protein [Cytobacillus horneckiae]PKG27173.1 hypothetical protein CWS20_20205 [Cytobacillus horneckiae]